MSDVGWILFFFVVGLGAILVEFVVPGVVIGVLGFLVVCGSIVYAFATGHPLLGSLLIGLTIVLMPVFFLAWRTVLRRMLGVEASEKGFRSTVVNYAELLGKEGESVSTLRPSGTMVIDGKRYSVVTRGEMLEKGTRVKVVEVTGNRIVVKKA